MFGKRVAKTLHHDVPTTPPLDQVLMAKKTGNGAALHLLYILRTSEPRQFFFPLRDDDDDNNINNNYNNNNNNNNVSLTL